MYGYDTYIQVCIYTIYIYIENNVDNQCRQSARTDSALTTGTNYQINLCSRLAPSQSSLSNTQNTTTSCCGRENNFMN